MMSTWNMGVHSGPAEETQPSKPNGGTVTTQPEQTIIPPQPSVAPMAAAMSLAVPGKSTADGMWLAVQSMVALKGRMEAETKAVQAAVAQIGSKVDTIAEMRKMLQDYSDKLTI